MTSSFAFNFTGDANNPERPVDKYESEGPVYRHQTNPSSGSVIAGTSLIN